MAYFPGNVLIIDDKFDIIHQVEPTDPSDKTHYLSFKGIKEFCESNGIPYISITDTNDTTSLKRRINAYDNIRLLILDLDLNGDGDVGPDDDYLTISLILEIALKKYGYFLLLVNSAHSEAWESIIKSLPSSINIKLFNNLTYVYNKTDKEPIYDSLKNICDNYSLELIYHFECCLNEARDKAFSNFFDFEKNSWEKIFKVFHRETGEMAHNDVSNLLNSIIKQHLISVKYPEVKDSSPEPEPDPIINRLVYETINYTKNSNNILDKHPKWTGNLYLTDISEEHKYALIINPECDIAQKKHLYYKILFGFELNDKTLPINYDPQNIGDGVPPLLPYRIGKVLNGKTIEWATKKHLESTVKKLKANQYLSILPYINDKTVFLDYRDINSIKESEMVNWKLILRLNEPMLTNIIDSYSNLMNRKGLLPIFND